MKFLIILFSAVLITLLCIDLIAYIWVVFILNTLEIQDQAMVVCYCLVYQVYSQFLCH